MTSKEKVKQQSIEINGVVHTPVNLPVEQRPPHKFNSREFSCGIFTLSLQEMFYFSLFWNNGNRPMPSPNYIRLRHEIAGGRFLYEAGNPIQFNTEGEIINGQTRLWAHIAEKKDFKVVVVWGCPPESIGVIDINSPRSQALASLLAEAQKTGKKITHEGLSHKNKQFAIVNSWFRYDNEMGKARVYSKGEIEEFIETHENSISLVLRNFPNENIRRAAFLAAMSKYFEIDPVKAEILFQQIAGEGNDLKKNSPGLCMRKYLENQSKKNKTHQMHDYYSTLKVIHAFHVGESMRNISFQKDWEPLDWFLTINQYEKSQDHAFVPTEPLRFTSGYQDAYFDPHQVKD